MPESNMSISVNGQSQVPPGFRFHPTEEELLQYYLKKKVSNLRIDLDVIGEVDLNKLEPWDIQEKCRIGTTPQNDWYFFSHKDKKYPTGTRTNRATAAGFWKATGRDKAILNNFRRIGMRKTLVFYKGRAPHGHKSDWIMHEYRLNHNSSTLTSSSSIIMEEMSQEEGWVVCRIFKKKSHHKTLDCHNRHRQIPVISSIKDDHIVKISTTTMFGDSTGNELDDKEGSLEQIFQCMTPNNNTTKEETNSNINGYNPNHGLESPNYSGEITAVDYNNNNGELGFHQDQIEMITTSWTDLDRLVASQLNGTATTTTVDYHSNNGRDLLRVCSAVGSISPSSIATTDDNYHNAIGQDYGSDELGLWSFAGSSSSLSSTDPICHVSDTPLHTYI